MTISTGVGPGGVAEPRSSGIDVIIVGLGILGLVAAIECHYKGHRVIGLEKSPEVRVLGDSIALGSNATKVMQAWEQGAVYRRLVAEADAVAALEVLDPAGKLYALDAMDGYGVGEGMIIQRATLVTGLYRHAVALGIDLRFGAAVTEYWEAQDGDRAGVTVNGGLTLAADCVIGADGVHSRTRDFVLGYRPPAQDSGLAAYRACFSAELVAGDPDAAWILKEVGERDRVRRYITDGGLGLTLATGKRGKNVVWQVWHRNEQAQAAESWERTSSAGVEDALALMQDWPVYPKIAAVLRHTPRDTLADYKIIARDPLPRWISTGGRIMILGDAAHAMSPIVGQGGGQSIEDAATLAICLELAGKARVPLGLQAVHALRFQRTKMLQESGNAIYGQMRDPDWEAIEKDPAIIKFPRPEWIFGYDVHCDVYEEFPAVVRAIQDGSPYRPRNVPEDGQYQIAHDYKAKAGE
ncbi:FAD-dependent oxidoreductase [Aspergillus aculeatinus CBS 121060]|uniref:FAD/NAD(P)-binding domain-containing protein n=1 Tax=Aspergillus aculeatinus CBS 121060 TaxID=1448322 RepID=A0ACD1H302_9EURO|nr:FAD/NAD(P)-binding domain-containing protein [Aspergillus aculeatinus CBS 121060]RAH68131.1 FAD/NAD(P)-binding domain-containing protein [Aspergillus aculeatinus CBS 121060]